MEKSEDSASELGSKNLFTEVLKPVKFEGLNDSLGIWVIYWVGYRLISSSKETLVDSLASLRDWFCIYGFGGFGRVFKGYIGLMQFQQRVEIVEES
jgi:hypothetical protein